MDSHQLRYGHPWYPWCDNYVCDRPELVTSVLEYAHQFGVIIIRATPQVGKTTLLKLLGCHIAYKELDLEPVFLSWEKREKRNNLPYEEYLQEYKKYWQEKNTEIRPQNPKARTIYLIDEAQGSYEEDGLWLALKNHRNTRWSPLFVLVCVYGATGVSHERDPNAESQAQRIHSLHRIELRPSMPRIPYMLFRREEVDHIVGKFANFHKCRFQNEVVDYLYNATGGHPGMVGILLSYVELLENGVSLFLLHLNVDLAKTSIE